MILRWVLAAVHLLALGIGLGAVYVRGKALSGRIDADKVRAALAADAWWGLAALLWVGCGLWRLFGSVEKDTAYYMGNHVFWTKMLLFIGILAMEIRPMITLSRWRRELARGHPTQYLECRPDLAAQLRAGRAGRPHGPGRHGDGPGHRRSLIRFAASFGSRHPVRRSAPAPACLPPGRSGLARPPGPVPRAGFSASS